MLDFKEINGAVKIPGGVFMATSKRNVDAQANDINGAMAIRVKAGIADGLRARADLQPFRGLAVVVGLQDLLTSVATHAAIAKESAHATGGQIVAVHLVESGT